MMKRHRISQFLVAAACLLQSDQHSFAQPLAVNFSSVESVAARSTLIVRAEIVDVTDFEPINEFGFQSIKLNIFETLKGEPRQELRFTAQNGYGHFDFNELQTANRELLLFFDSWKMSRSVSQSYRQYPSTRFPYSLVNGVILDSDKIRLASESMTAPMSNDMTELTTAQQLLDAIKRYLKGNSARDAPSVSRTIRVPDRLNLGGIPGTFRFMLDADLLPSKYKPPNQVTVLADFEAVRQRFEGVTPPTAVELKPTYDRSSNGYVGIYSIELMASDSDLIVRGIIADSCFVASAADAPTTGPLSALKFVVRESIKGNADQELICLVHDTRNLQKLISDQQEAVLFLDRTDADDCSDTVRQFPYIARATTWDDFVIVLDDQSEALFADMTWHRKSQPILERLREIRSMVHLNLPFSVHAPDSLVEGISIHGNRYSLVYLPVDSHLEANARKWTRSANKDLRWLGAKSLLYFKSDENAARLRGLLDDDAAWKFKETFPMLGGPFPNESPKHLIRWEAFQILSAWGDPCEKPDFGRSER